MVDTLLLQRWLVDTLKVDILFLVGEHVDVEGDEFEIAGGCGVVSSLQLIIKPVSHRCDARVYRYTHLRYLIL